jgi:hypothetical protein
LRQSAFCFLLPIFLWKDQASSQEEPRQGDSKGRFPKGCRPFDFTLEKGQDMRYTKPTFGSSKEFLCKYLKSQEAILWPEK